MSHPSFLIFGESGQVARALKAQLGDNALYVGRDQADFMHPESCVAHIMKHRPAVIINTVAHTQVDKAETEQDAAFQINAHTPAALARAATEIGAIFVHYSTDYVFAGQGTEAYTETDSTDPLNAYGKSKCAGEEAIAAIGGKYLIFRTSWVYDGEARNFLTTMLRLASEREELRVVADQIGAPTYAPHIATATLHAITHAQIQQHFPSGIYHLCNAGEVSWHGFAEEIFTQARLHHIPLKITACHPIPASDYPTPATRPSNSRLSCEKLATVLDTYLPPWQQGVKEAINHYKARS
jgi:dTDP-4-dehydrorhamnose reductase